MSIFIDENRKEVNINNLYKNGTLFLVCSGPSLNKLNLDLLKQPGIVTMGVNNSPKVFRPNIWTMVDSPQSFLYSIWRDPKILKLVPDGKASQKDDNILFDNNSWKMTNIHVRDCQNIVYYNRNDHFNHDTYLSEDSVNWGNSGFTCECGHVKKDKKAERVCSVCGDSKWGTRSVFLAAIKLAYSLGFRRVFLLGCDFKMDEKTKYAWNQDRAPGAIRNNSKTYIRLNERMDKLRPIFEKNGFFVFNSTPDSGLKSFDYIDYEMAVKMALSGFPDVKNENAAGLYERKAKERQAKKMQGSGMIYYNYGKRCLARLAISLYTLRKVYDGPVSILADRDGFDECFAIGNKFGAGLVECSFDNAGITKNIPLLNKCRLNQKTPYDNTLFVDSDTVFLKDISKLFELSNQNEFVTTCFSDWKPTQGLIKRRIEQWTEIEPQLVKNAFQYPYALNTAVFAFTKKSKWMQDWFNLAIKGKGFFIPDEIACQMAVWKYPHFIAGASFNESCRYGKIRPMTKMIHFHGKKHCRIESGKYLNNCDRWYKLFDELRNEPIVKAVYPHDDHLMKFLHLHDAIKAGKPIMNESIEPENKDDL